MLGITGVDKRVAVKQLTKYQTDIDFQHPVAYKDLIRDYIRPGLNIEVNAFLDNDTDRQLSAWREAWQMLLEDHPPGDESDVIVGMHCVLARSVYGIRAVFDIDLIKQFAPTHVVTLLDNIYMHSARTRRRAAERSWVGTPTLEQLLEARRAESLLGDLIVSHLEDLHVNWHISVQHPARTLHRLLYEDVLPIYLSFPITVPRIMVENDRDSSGIHDVNRFLRQAYEIEEQNGDLVFFCPLAIDELPLLNQASRPSREGEEAVFDAASQTWNVRDFLGEETPLLVSDSLHSVTEPVRLPVDEIRNAEQYLRGDVGRRDYRLVKQSRRLLAFNPYYSNRLSSGADNEIRYAGDLRIPVVVFQDQNQDGDNRAEHHLRGSGGALGDRPGSEYVQIVRDLDKAFSLATQRP